MNGALTAIGALLFVVYAGCGGLLWLTAHFLAPVGYGVSLGRAVATVLLFVVLGCATNLLLRPLIGAPLTLLAEVGLSVIVAKHMLRLTFWRAVAAVLIYWFALLGLGLAYLLTLQRLHPH